MHHKILHSLMLSKRYRDSKGLFQLKSKLINENNSFIIFLAGFGIRSVALCSFALVALHKKSKMSGWLLSLFLTQERFALCSLLKRKLELKIYVTLFGFAFIKINNRAIYSSWLFSLFLKKAMRVISFL